MEAVTRCDPPAPTYRSFILVFRLSQVVGYSAKGDNFDTFQGAVLSLFVLTTEENFPMVADPAFSQRPFVSTVFLSIDRQRSE